ncbi:MAG: phospholipase D family protein [Gammaproteobacteria bacterium]|jgi:putative cardiolipin synthase
MDSHNWLAGILLASFLLLAGGCASLPDNSDRQESYALADTSDTTIGQISAKRMNTEGDGQDGFLLLESGLDAFVARAVLTHHAERSIDLQYYLYHRDLVGYLFMNLLIKAADRGVRVRLLVDDMDLEGRDTGLVALDSHPNIELRIFNPFDRKIGRMPQFVTGFGSVTRRMHNKSFTVDNQVTIVGGRNIGDEYFDADPTLEFADLDVMVFGDVVKDVSHAFDLYWNSELAYPATTLIDERPSEDAVKKMRQDLADFAEQQKDSEYVKALKNSELANKMRDREVEYHYGNAVVVYDHPEKISSERDATELHLMTQLAPHFEDIKKELIIFSPYFVPGDEGVEFFERLINKGVTVKIITNSLASNDVGIVHAGYSKYRKALLHAGVELYEMNKKLTRSQRKEKKGVGSSSKASLHAKSFILDREKIFIGSLNLDPRSFYENSEIGVIIESPEVATKMAEGFDNEIAKGAFRLELVMDQDDNEYIHWHGIENGEPITYEVDPHTSFWRRMGVGIMRILPIESQL